MELGEADLAGDTYGHNMGARRLEVVGGRLHRRAGLLGHAVRNDKDEGVATAIAGRARQDVVGDVVQAGTGRSTVKGRRVVEEVENLVLERGLVVAKVKVKLGPRPAVEERGSHAHLELAHVQQLNHVGDKELSQVEVALCNRARGVQDKDDVDGVKVAEGRHGG